MINSTKESHYFIKQVVVVPIACKSWFANKYLTQHTISSKFRKNYIKQKVNRVIYLENFIPKLVANFSEQFIYSDNS